MNNGGYYTNNDPASPKRKIVFGILIYLIIAALALLVVFVFQTVVNPAETTEIEGGDSDEYLVTAVDPGETEEKLSPELERQKDTIAHGNYVSTSDETKYLDWDIVSAIPRNKANERAAVFAVAFAAISQRNDNYYNDIIYYGVENVGAENGIATRELTAINSHALDYYLDNGAVVVAQASGAEPFSESGKYVLIYAGQPLLGVYRYYSTEPICAECSYPTAINKLQLFAAMQTNLKFYVIGPQGGK